MMKTIQITNNQEMQIKEYKSQRVVTFKDIDRIHERVDGTASRNFLSNKDKFIENLDYFNLCKNENNEIRGLGEIPNRGITLITESGYLMLAKSFTDDLAWEVQRKLVNSYFRGKEISGDLEFISNQVKLMMLELENSIGLKVDSKIDKRLEELSEYYRPTHATKLDICSYIKNRLGLGVTNKEYELVKQRILLVLNANKWQDVPAEVLLDSIGIIDESINVIVATRINNQISLFD